MAQADPKTPGLGRTLLWLSSLYVVQGLPYGFQRRGLRGHLAELNPSEVSNTLISLAGFLALPWMLKVLWAPAVDRFYSRRLGRRRSWILPLQLGLVGVFLVGAFVSPDDHLLALMLVVLFANLFAATMDIAVDGVAVDLLDESKLGLGNIAQVVGYKVGMVLGGGVFLWLSAHFGWSSQFFAMAAVTAMALIVSWRMKEPAPRAEVLAVGTEPARGEVLRELGGLIFRKEAFVFLLVVATYKAGEEMGDEVLDLFLIRERGFTKEDLGLYSGTWGMAFSIAGSFAGGILASRVPLFRALVITAALRVVPLAGELGLAWMPEPLGISAVTTVIGSEAFFGGALTTVMFAFMMSRVDARIGASHYTALATVEVFGKMAAGTLGAVLSDHVGYVPVFALATVLSLAFLGLLPFIRAVGVPQPAES